MNHPGRVKLLIVSPCQRACILSSVSSSFQAKTLRKAIKRASSKWCGFHLHVCSVGATVSTSAKKNPFLSIFLCVWNWFFTANRGLRIPKNHKKKEHTIWYFSGNLIPGQQTLAEPGVEPVFGRGIWEREFSGMGACISKACVRMGEVVIILVCAVGSAGALLWHATRLHSICSNQNRNTPGAGEAGQAQPGHKPS